MLAFKATNPGSTPDPAARVRFRKSVNSGRNEGHSIHVESPFRDRYISLFHSIARSRCVHGPFWWRLKFYCTSAVPRGDAERSVSNNATALLSEVACTVLRGAPRPQTSPIIVYFVKQWYGLYRHCEKFHSARLSRAVKMCLESAIGPFYNTAA